MSHPTIDLVKLPEDLYLCPQPVYNCIPFTFRSLDFISQTGTTSGFIITFGPENYPDGVEVSLANQTFTTQTPPQDLNTFSWQGSPEDIALSFYNMLTSIYYFGQNYSLEIFNGNTVLGIAYEVGEVETEASFPVTVPPTGVYCSGMDTEYLPNYLIVVEVWECIQGVRSNLISQMSYEPNLLSSEVAIDLSELLQNEVYTTFPYDRLDEQVTLDTTFKKQICLRYGEVYSTGSELCDANTLYFEELNPFTVINSSYEAYNLEGIAPQCFSQSVQDTRFYTNRPQFVGICPDSISWLWYCYDEVLKAFIDLNLGGGSGLPFNFNVLYTFYYTDGTQEEVIGGNINTAETGMLIVPSGLGQLTDLYDTSKNINTYSVEIIGGTDNMPEPSRLSEVYNFKVVPCCGTSLDFYFLNSLGGYDTITFNGDVDINLNLGYTEVCTFDNCELEVFNKGITVSEFEAYKTYKLRTKLTEMEYTVGWVTEFLKSSKKYVKKQGIFYQAVFTDLTVGIMKDLEDNLILDLNYKLNIGLKTHYNEP